MTEPRIRLPSSGEVHTNIHDVRASRARWFGDSEDVHGAIPVLDGSNEESVFVGPKPSSDPDAGPERRSPSK